MAKYKIPVVIQTIASKTVGFIECDSVEEYSEKAGDLWESMDYEYPTTNVSNDFDLSDWDIHVIDSDDLRFYKEQD